LCFDENSNNLDPGADILDRRIVQIKMELMIKRKIEMTIEIKIEKELIVDRLTVSLGGGGWRTGCFI
jgi:hypothetical protein